MSRRRRRRKRKHVTEIIPVEHKNTIAYVHGLGSTGNSNTVQLLRKYLPNYNIISHDISIYPAVAESDVHDYKHENIDMVIGSSLGGFYAQAIIGYKGIKGVLVNPALKPLDVIGNTINLGTYEYFGHRDDGNQTYVLDDEYVEEMKHEIYEMNRLLNNEETIKENTKIFIGKNDDIVDYSTIEDMIDKYYDKSKVEFVDMGHRMTEEFVRDTLVPYIKNCLEN